MVDPYSFMLGVGAGLLIATATMIGILWGATREADLVIERRRN